jgi:hypothetical protein
MLCMRLCNYDLFCKMKGPMRGVCLRMRNEIFVSSWGGGEGCCLVITHDVKCVLYRSFPEY